MWLRQAFFRWLFPAAFVLPLWLLIGWAVFNGGWAFLFLLIAIPSVFVGQLILAFLVRARPSVRVTRAVSWWDVAGFGLWHVLTIVVGCFPASGFGPALVGAIIVAIALFWSSLWQLWSEAKGSGGIRVVATSWRSRSVAEEPKAGSARDEVYIIREKSDADD
jgi:hypothetical protein